MVRFIIKRLALLISPIRKLREQRDESSREIRNIEGVSHRAAIPAFARNYWRNTEALSIRTRGKKAYAIIGSTGRTATHWLAAAFNLHTQVLFSHGPDLEPEKNVPKDKSDEIDKRIHRQMSSFNFADIDGYFGLLESRGDYVVYGNVHGVLPLNVYKSPESYRRHYYGCAVFRHPVPRIESLVNKWTSYLGDADDPRQEILELAKFKASDQARHIARHYGIPAFDVQDILFIKAIDAVLPYDYGHLTSGMPLFVMERLVADTEYFLALFYEATAGLVEPTRTYVKALQQLMPIDRLAEGAHTAKDVYHSWDTWKQKYFLDELQRLNLLVGYELLGYNLKAILAGPRVMR